MHRAPPSGGALRRGAAGVHVHLMNSPATPLHTTKALHAWLAAASSAIFLIASVILTLILLPDLGFERALLAAVLCGGACGGIAFLALRHDARRPPPG